MGQRANLLIGVPGRYELYYSHWAANRLDEELFWGPETASVFIRAQRSEAEGAAWLDDVWAEGGAVMNTAERTLVWWGGEDTLYDVPLRRLLLDWMRLTWAGWEVRWAHREIAELAEYAGLASAEVLTRAEPRGRAAAPDLSEPEELDWMDSVISVRFEDRVALFPSCGDADSRLFDCDALVTAARREGGLLELDVSTRTDDFPSSGAHLDVARREVVFWTATGRARGAGPLQAANPGWKVSWALDRFEAQLERAPTLRFPAPSVARHVEGLRQILLRDPARARTDILGAGRAISPTGSVEVNKFALRDDRGPGTLDERMRMVDAIRARLARGR